LKETEEELWRRLPKVLMHHTRDALSNYPYSQNGSSVPAKGE